MPRLLAATITPSHAQMLLTTSPDAERPQWVTGEEAAVASPVAVAIATIQDFDNRPQRVGVEVWVNEQPSMDRYVQVLQCPLLVSSWGVALEDVLGDDQHRVPVPPGEYEATIFVKPVPNPSHVRIVLTNTYLPDRSGSVLNRFGHRADFRTANALNPAFPRRYRLRSRCAAGLRRRTTAADRASAR